MIDLNAVSGSDNLLGNLLCALLGLLDPLAALQIIVQLLESINAILQNLATVGGGAAA